MQEVYRIAFLCLLIFVSTLSTASSPRIRNKHGNKLKEKNKWKKKVEKSLRIENSWVLWLCLQSLCECVYVCLFGARSSESILKTMPGFIFSFSASLLCQVGNYKNCNHCLSLHDPIFSISLTDASLSFNASIINMLYIRCLSLASSHILQTNTFTQLKWMCFPTSFPLHSNCIRQPFNFLKWQNLQQILMHFKSNE